MVPGQTVLVPTDVQPGAFPDEKLVTVNTISGPISGFAKNNFIVSRNNSNYLQARVKNVSTNVLTVVLFGSFFTTTGLADIRKGTSILKAT